MRSLLVLMLKLVILQKKLQKEVSHWELIQKYLRLIQVRMLNLSPLEIKLTIMLVKQAAAHQSFPSVLVQLLMIGFLAVVSMMVEGTGLIRSIKQQLIIITTVKFKTLLLVAYQKIQLMQLTVLNFML